MKDEMNRIDGEKVMNYYLRKLQQKDCQYMLEWMHDKSINCVYTDKIRNATLETVQHFIAESEHKWEQKKSYHFAIVDEKDEYIGTISLKNIEKIQGAEYAISMRKSYQGQGIASWATQEILKIAFDKMDLNRVYLNVLSDNEHASKFYQKNGFRYEGESKKCIQIGNEIKSLKWYAILAEEYRGETGEE